MKKKKQVLVLCLIAIMLFSFAGCGASKSMATADTAANTFAESGEIYSEDAAYEESAQGSGAEVSENAATTNRKLIKNVELSVETQEYETLLANIEKRVNEAGGYIENRNSYNGSYYNSERMRSSDMTIRIPADKLDSFLDKVAEASNITYRSESVSDVTLQYVDIESRKNALKAEESRLLELMERAETIEDLITIESRLTDVRYEIESTESQLRVYDNQIDYSTVYISISEVKLYTPDNPKTVWEKISTGFVSSMRNVGEGIVDFFIWFIINIPYWIILAVVVVIIIFIIKGIRKHKAKKRAKEELIRQCTIQNINQEERKQ